MHSELYPLVATATNRTVIAIWMVASAATEPVLPCAHSSSAVVPRTLLREDRKMAGEYSLIMVTKTKTSAPANAGRISLHEDPGEGPDPVRAADPGGVVQFLPDLHDQRREVAVAGGKCPHAERDDQNPHGAGQLPDAAGRVGHRPEEADTDDHARHRLWCQRQILDRPVDPDLRTPGDQHRQRGQKLTRPRR